MATVRILKDNRVAIRSQIQSALIYTLQDAAELIASYGRANVPVLTGYLFSTIGSEPSGYLRFTAFARAPYAYYVEAGTVNSAAQPFMMPSALLVLGIIPLLARRRFSSVR